MSHYLKPHGTRATPQGEPLPGQVANSAGGHAWSIGAFARLRRFLILGSEGGSYYAGQRELTTENVDALAEALREDGPRAVELIVEVSEGGLAPKNDQAIFALAYAVAEGDEPTKRRALDSLERVCRIGTHLFMFVDFLDGSFGKATGRAKRRALGRWYTEKEPGKLAYQLVKYRSRHDWTHKDVLRLAHPEPPTALHRELFDFACGREGALETLEDAAPELEIVRGFRAAQRSVSPAHTAEIAGRFRLPREALLTEHLTSPEVWLAMLDAGMPTTALVRNLANMTRAGVVAPNTSGLARVLEALRDEDRIRKSRIHPLNVLMAARTYASGRGLRGQNTWKPVVQVVDALDAAFYTAFKNAESSGKRLMLCLDVSGSMDGGDVAGTPLTPREAAAAMALVQAAADPDTYECVTFSCQGGAWIKPESQPRVHSYGAYSRARHHVDDGIAPFNLSPRQRLDDVVRATAELPMGGTDCSLPMQYALANAREVDAFVVYTDSETWAGGIHPAQALAEYRRQSGIDARLVVVGMVANDFSIADPNDPGSLDVVGFDSSAPGLVADFAAGRV